MSTKNEKRYLLICNGSPKSGALRPPEWTSVAPLVLWTDPGRANVALRITDITDWMAKKLPPVVEDLVEIAALVYAADQACRRAAGLTFTYGKEWHRTFRFEIAVRMPEFWNRTDVLKVLRATLGFLSYDDYEFAFTRWENPTDFGDYLEYKRGQPMPNPPQRVALFSGGLDSLAGVTEEIFIENRRLALVSHKPVHHVGKMQREMVDEIRRRAKLLVAPVPVLHFAVKANKTGELSQDNTQRSRSFLYAAMAAAVAEVFKLDSIHFYENGIVSVNLPLCGQEVGGRATRTTHPQVLAGFARLFSLVLERNFEVRNEYLWDTKEDVLRRLLRTEHADLAKQSFSCIHTRRLTLKAPHCGLCSQCLSRWIASTGAEYGDYDPHARYDVDVLTGSRKTDPDRILAERYIGWARRIEQMSTVDEFVRPFAGELARVYPFVPLPEADVAANLFELHHRHAEQVRQAILSPMLEHVQDLWAGKLPDSCVLAYAFDPKQVFQRSNLPSRRDITGPVMAANKGEEPFIESALQRAILAKLKDKAMRTRTLAQALRIDQPKLYKRGGIKELAAAGKVQKHARIGYYRPDAPPPEYAEALESSRQ